jgi:hypothetical protein
MLHMLYGEAIRLPSKLISLCSDFMVKVKPNLSSVSSLMKTTKC